MGKRIKTAKPTLPNAGLEAEYRRKLDALIKAMTNDIEKHVESVYGKREDEIVEDASPSKQLINLINRRMVRWQKRFDNDAETIARWFVSRSDSTTRAKLGKELAKASGMTVKFRTTKAVEDVLDSLIAENVSLIKSIPEQYHTGVNSAVMESVRAGRDLGTLTDTLHERYGVTKRRAAMIARDQNNKSTESIGIVRNKSLGITEATWFHRHGSKQPRASHIAANGKTFNLSEGLLIDGEMMFPGQDYNCNCSYKPIIPGWKQ